VELGLQGQKEATEWVLRKTCSVALWVGRLLPLEPGRSGVHGQGPLALVVGSPRGVLSAARCAAPCPATLDVWLPARA
jgi:hypothetical protein